MDKLEFFVIVVHPASARSVQNMQERKAEATPSLTLVQVPDRRHLERYWKSPLSHQACLINKEDQNKHSVARLTLF